MNDVTQILSAIEQGDPKAAEQLLPLVYNELRNLAIQKLGRVPPGQTLQPTALVHEAYLRLVGGGDNSGTAGATSSPPRPRRCAASWWRTPATRAAASAGATGHAPTFDVDQLAVPELREDLLALDEALDRLAAADPEAAQLVNLRYFAGLTLSEAATVMDVSPRGRPIACGPTPEPGCTRPSKAAGRRPSDSQGKWRDSLPDFALVGSASRGHGEDGAQQATSRTTPVVECIAMGERAIFFEAMEQADPAERSAYLDDACAGDPDLRRRIEALLRSHATAGDFLDMPAAEQLAAGSGMPADRGQSGAGEDAPPRRPAAGVTLDSLAQSRRPDSLGRLGHYEALKVIGEGGMGTVYEAEQDNPRRTVALKVVRPGLASPAVAQALHPRGPDPGPTAPPRHRAGLRGRPRR